MRKFGVGGAANTARPREHEALDFLSNLMIAHVPCPSGNMKIKAVYLGLMIRRWQGTSRNSRKWFLRISRGIVF
ncbi:unnamed protein product [Gongylonema pulchrum]|uniref:Uncharacterized protein n=1 Tax=Gongylonema pulchrum TaxID=637853 RepID=A0A183DLW4_9BILA|nr:unnamed protein product [Gongylonema pulchrum]